MVLTDAHARMVKDLYLSLEKRSNRNHSESPEYDIQQMISDFYTDWFRNTKFSIEREKEGKFDIVVYENEKIALLYEVKTFFKSNENIRENILFKDAIKLSNRKDKLADTNHKYMLIAGKKCKLNKEAIPDFVNKHQINSREHTEINAPGYIKLRPSRKQMPIGDTFVMSWEVMDSQAS